MVNIHNEADVTYTSLDDERISRSNTVSTTICSNCMQKELIEAILCQEYKICELIDLEMLKIKQALAYGKCDPTRIIKANQSASEMIGQIANLQKAIAESLQAIKGIC